MNNNMNNEWETQWREIDAHVGMKLCIGDNFTYVETRLLPEEMKGIKELIEHALTSQRADWLRSEIEKVEEMKRAYLLPKEERHDYDNGYNQALTSIITWYKEELKVLEGKQDDWNEDMERNEELMNDDKEELKVLESKK